jgi:hypothetical protein
MKAGSILLGVALMVVAVTSLPNGFLLAMLPTDGTSNHLYSWSINPSTGEAKQLQVSL